MALSRTMSQLVTLAQGRANKKSTEDGQVDSDEWKALISEAYGELHGAVSKVGARYFDTEATITATGAASYALPSDHLSTIGVDFVADAAGNRRFLAQLMVQEGYAFAGKTGEAWMYALTGSTIVLYPTPSSGTYKHLYVPQPADYSSVGNGTSIDLINNDGLAFVVWRVASIAMHQGEANQQRAITEAERALGKVTEWAVDRALTEPKRRVVHETDVSFANGGFISPGDWRFRP